MNERLPIERYANLFNRGTLRNIAALNASLDFQHQKLFPLYSNPNIIELTTPLDKKIPPITELIVLRGHIAADLSTKEASKTPNREM